MEINSIANFATPARTPEAQDTVGLAVQKKASDIQASTASALIDSLPPANPAGQAAASESESTRRLPPHLGKNVNTTA
jgi:hypothetical protein